VIDRGYGSIKRELRPGEVGQGTVAREAARVRDPVKTSELTKDTKSVDKVNATGNNGGERVVETNVARGRD
jgi:hypothetical protein